MNAGYITMSLDDLAKKLGLPEGVKIVGAQIVLHQHETIHISLAGPGLPELRGGPDEQLQMVWLKARFE